ncbi:MAG: hypothetical protein DDT40_00349 [candidate division WS2 bacterium]|uniref:Uncharacterized protein n=1 Tax=Psychracetigena formicireducens TaxID=2986056 RepID=A0A9E2F1N7_PSYF1|nr:hypothetical protein [Candidatus Psychracetigena formicireducens]MBT9144897.1 hypothetical protein [Candidatus Psychracetigena formicireducens]MBT9150182.1 hypothetical protein [Candidatus Psychracetigena formicireducens]
MKSHFNLAEETARILPLEKGKILLMSQENKEAYYSALKLLRRSKGQSNLFICYYGQEVKDKKVFQFLNKRLSSLKTVFFPEAVFQQVIIIEFPLFLEKPEDIVAEAFLSLEITGMLSISLNTQESSSYSLLGKLSETRGILQKVGFKEPFYINSLAEFPGVYLIARKPVEGSDEMYKELFKKENKG